MFAYKGSTALITGASGGLGGTFAERLAAKGSHLVLVARSEEKLHALAQRLVQQFQITTTALPTDLASSQAVRELVAHLRGRTIDVDLLINNAGFGVFQKFLETPLERQMAEIEVNVCAMVSLTHALAPGMVARKRGGVINISSIAGFQPVAGANIYAASKSFVLLFSEALAQELAGAGVRVLAVCPGPVATGFYADKTPDLAKNQMDDPQTVVEETLRAFDRGKRVLVPGKFSARLGAFVPRLLPRTLVSQISERVAQRLNRESGAHG
jgi:uncharacterized protein